MGGLVISGPPGSGKSALLNVRRGKGRGAGTTLAIGFISQRDIEAIVVWGARTKRIGPVQLKQSRRLPHDTHSGCLVCMRIPNSTVQHLRCSNPAQCASCAQLHGGEIVRSSLLQEYCTFANIVVFESRRFHAGVEA